VDNIKTQQAIDAIAVELHALTERTGDVLEYREDALGWKGSTSLRLVRGGGSDEVDGFINPNLVADLRDAMASPETGTWLKCTICVTHEGEITSDFDYDSKPDFGFLPILDEDIVDELTNWPRNDENIPRWMRELMDQMGITNPPAA
jgi:hypothetical protein